MKRIFVAILTFVFLANTAMADQWVISVPESDPNFEYYLERTDFTGDIMNAIKEASNIWLGYIKPSTAQTRATTLGVTRVNEENAFCGSDYVETEGEQTLRTAMNAVLNGVEFTPIEGKEYDGGMQIGYTDPNYDISASVARTALYQTSSDSYLMTVVHEMGHGLGIISNSQMLADDIVHFSDAFVDDDGRIIPEESQKLSIFDSLLRARDMYSDSEETADVVSSGKGMIVNTYADKSAKDYGVNSDYVFDVVHYSPYFVGTNAMQVLARSESADLNVLTGIVADAGGLKNYSCAYDRYYTDLTGRPIVYGVPIHPFDNLDTEADLSHIELRNSMMSHQSFRNWIVFMEAELAVLKDVGYDIDLKEHFGQSYYLNGTPDTIDTAYSSSKDYAVGTHIYSDNNVITQDADITLSGQGAFGVRIEGVGNTYTLNDGKTISATGDNSIALGADYGKEHKITLASGSAVKVMGENSVAVSFDLGKNTLGEAMASRGSYSYVDMKENLPQNIEKNDLDGELVTNFDVSGTIEASGKAKTAIYISDNAYVKKININSGAVVKGDIISKWNSVTQGLYGLVYQKLGDNWEAVDPNNPAYFTDLNINGDFSYAGTISGATQYELDGVTYDANTLRLNIDSGGAFTINGDTDINVYSISMDNGGTVSLDPSKTLNLSVLSGNVTGTGGSITVNGNLNLASNVANIYPSVTLNSGSSLSLMNGALTKTTFADLTSDGANLYFDLGDTLNIETASGSATICGIKVNKNDAKNIADGTEFALFDDKTITLYGLSNFYYKGNKYSLSQSESEQNILVTQQEGSGYCLGDAAGDETTPSYIVTEAVQTKGGGTVAAREFEIMGEDVNFNGYSGLTIDGDTNKETVLLTGVYGAETNLTLKNKGNLTVDATEKDIQLGNSGETALDMFGASTVYLKAQDKAIEVLGDIKGESTDDTIYASGKSVTVNNIDPVTVNQEADEFNLNGLSEAVTYNLNSGVLNVSNDANFSDANVNTLNLNGGGLCFANGETSEIKSKMNINSTSKVAIDVDLKDLSSDVFVFENEDDLTVNYDMVVGANILNKATPLTANNIKIPFVAPSYNNTKLVGRVQLYTQDILTPIFKYNFDFTEDTDDDTLDFLLTHGSSSNYNNLNPAIVAFPVAAQAGAYLTQLTNYEEALANLDSRMLGASKIGKAKKAWFRPYATFEQVALSGGPKVENTAYGGIAGIDSDIKELGEGWSMVWGGYVGYNGSHQNYDGVNIYQNAGTFGLNLAWYRGNFFTGLTANISAANARSNTMYGDERGTIVSTGFASKTGFNVELCRGNLIFQPSLLMSYSFINGISYTNAAGVVIGSDGLNAFQIAPSVKFIWKLPKGWQFYLATQMVWNLNDKAKYYAADVALPQMSVNPYIQYGLGLQKEWSDNFSGHLQTMITDGGRSGVALTAGFQWRIGR